MQILNTTTDKQTQVHFGVIHAPSSRLDWTTSIHQAGIRSDVPEPAQKTAWATVLQTTFCSKSVRQSGPCICATFETLAFPRQECSVQSNSALLLQCRCLRWLARGRCRWLMSRRWHWHWHWHWHWIHHQYHWTDYRPSCFWVSSVFAHGFARIGVSCPSNAFRTSACLSNSPSNFRRKTASPSPKQRHLHLAELTGDLRMIPMLTLHWPQRLGWMTCLGLVNGNR